MCRRVLDAGEDHRGLVAFAASAEGVAAGDDTEAERSFARAVQVCRRTGTAPLEAEARWRWAARTGRVEQLDAAAEAYRRLGFGPPWLEHVRARRAAVVGG